MAELLRVVRRGPDCGTVKAVSGPDEHGAYLRCDLAPGHPGPLHYDSADRIWWFAVA
jgi:hypothetical protein